MSYDLPYRTSRTYGLPVWGPLLALAGLLLMGTPAAGTEPAKRVTTIALVDKPWGFTFNGTGYKVQADGVKPDGRRYFFATNPVTLVSISITLEAVSEQATAEGCRLHLDRVARTPFAKLSQGITRSEVRNLTIIEYVIPEAGGQRIDQWNLIACTGHDRVYADVHLSKLRFQPGDESLLRTVLDHIHITSGIAPTSLELFQAGSAPYLHGDYRQAIPHYERALATERENPSLSPRLRRILIENLGTAYNQTHNPAGARATFEYGLVQDPTYAPFHYHLACIYADLGDPVNALRSLQAAFRYKTGQPADASLPDPRYERAFRLLMNDPDFARSIESLFTTRS